jgi:hypothetical protein
MLKNVRREIAPSQHIYKTRFSPRGYIYTMEQQTLHLDDILIIAFWGLSYSKYSRGHEMARYFHQ